MLKEEVLQLCAKCEDAGVTLTITSLLKYMQDTQKVELNALDISKIGLQCFDQIAAKYGIPAKKREVIRQAHEMLDKEFKS